MGDVTESWVDSFKEYAEIVSGKADEIFESQRRNALATWPQFVAMETYIFKIHHRDGIDSLKHRIIFDGKIYGIFPPIIDNRRREMLIQAIFLSANIMEPAMPVIVAPVSNNYHLLSDGSTHLLEDGSTHLLD